jgi:hypothetical protein
MTNLNVTQQYINLSIKREHLQSKKYSKIIEFITNRFNEEILTERVDLEQFVKSKKDRKVAARKLASRLCKTGEIESHEGVYIPKGHKKYLNNLNTKFLRKIKSKWEKTKVFKSKQRFIEQIQLFISQNRWCFPSTHLTAQVSVPTIYKKFTELNIFERDNGSYVIPCIVNHLFPDLPITFYINSNDTVIIKIGDRSNPIQANASIICSALLISHNYLISTNQFWKLGLDILTIHNWTISIPYIYSNTLNGYTKLNGKIRDDDLGLELKDEKTHLLLRSKLPRSRLKPIQLPDFLTKYDPMTKFVTPTIFGNQAQNVTFCTPTLAPNFVFTLNQAQNVTLCKNFERRKNK